MRYLSNLKTSNKISLIFSFFNFISLLFLLIAINIIYFFVWTNNQKQESMYDMNINYNSYIEWMSENNIDAFKKYILKKDTIIIPNNWDEMICSKWVSKKLHWNLKLLDDKFFYKDEWKTYFIFSNNYKSIWEVKILFDITPYLNSQLIIIKISAIFIFLFIFISILLWKYFASYSLRRLKYISNKALKIDLNKDLEWIEIIWNKNDEINILADTLNKSFSRIKNSNDNMKQFLTDVSHEFKTPLMVINSKIDFYNKFIEKKWELNSKNNKLELDKLLLSIKLNTKKLNKLIETLFVLSRITEWIQEFKKNNVNLSNYIENNLSLYSEKLKEKNIKIIKKIDKNILIKIEESTFNIILENLITNAIKFSKKDSNIEIWINKDFFYIKDYWDGISEDDLNKIWNKFYKKDINKEWFWVWLFLLKRIIKLYNWKIKVESKIWEWTKFIVYFL